jgi:hypothetical protein
LQKERLAKHNHSSLFGPFLSHEDKMFASKVEARLSGAPPIGLTHKHYTSLESLARQKHSSSNDSFMSYKDKKRFLLVAPLWLRLNYVFQSENGSTLLLAVGL